MSPPSLKYVLSAVLQVVIFQKYTNLSSAPIEAKYVVPLSDYAAVCGFEAFINGKHVVGQVSALFSHLRFSLLSAVHWD